MIAELFRQAQPFIRFRTGDITEGVDFSPCPCGRTPPRLKRIIGRKSSELRVRGLFVYPEQVQGIVASHPELRRCPIVVDRPGTSDRLLVRAEYVGDLPPKELRPVLVAEIKDAVQLRCDVEFLAAGMLPADAPASVDRRHT